MNVREGYGTISINFNRTQIHFLSKFKYILVISFKVNNIYFDVTLLTQLLCIYSGIILCISFLPRLIFLQK